MRKFIKGLIVLNYFFTASQSIANTYYFQQSNNSLQKELITGDSHFTYTFHLIADGQSEETFEKDLTRIKVFRNKSNPTMWVENRTKYGYLYLKYRIVGKQWENTESSFRKYRNFFKDDFDEICSTLPSKKNQIDISEVSTSLEKQNFSNLIFEKSCHEKLNEKEFNILVNSTYLLLTSDANALALFRDPKILSCVTLQGKESRIRTPFQDLQKKTSSIIKNSKSIDEVQNNNLVPFPISCEFDGKTRNACGSVIEGKKVKISLDVRCLKENRSTDQQKTISLFMHEFAHTVRSPKSLSETQVQELEKGNCNPKDVVFTSNDEINISKDKVIAAENSKQTGAKTIAGDVVNPYAAFVDTSPAQASSQDTRIATNSATTATEVSRSVGTTTPNSQRSVASVGALTNAVSSFSVNTNVPTMQQQAQYQNVKTYVYASIGTIAKKIAPIVSYVESPAFAATLPPSSFSNSNSGDSANSETETPTAVSNATNTLKLKSPSNSASANRSTNEIAAGAASGGSSGTSASLGTSSSSGSTARSPTAINRNTSRPSVDSGLDNAYALKIRKRLVSERSYREELRSKGVQIEFADGYKFETPGSKVQYTEQNGVLVRGK